MDEKDYDQLNLFKKSSGPSGSPAETFGCCSRYRQCSDARRCVIPERDYSVNCSYRKALEAGKIYYGKNASNFSQDVYSELIQGVDSLPSSIRRIFDNIVINFCEYYRGIQRLIVRNEATSKLSATGFFTFQPLGGEFPEKCGFDNYLRPIILDSPIFRRACAIRKSELDPLRQAIKASPKGSPEEKRLSSEYKELEKKKPAEDSKRFMCSWLNSEGQHIRDFLAQPYCYAVLKVETLQYLEKYYQDYLSSGCSTRIYALSPMAEDGLLSPSDRKAEETRRIKLSRGYSPDDKALRIASINNALSEKNFAGKKRSLNEGAIDCQKTPTNRLLGKMCVITGTLSRPREDAFLDILKCGGHVADTPVVTMDILVVGRQEWSELNNGIASRKIQKAIDLRDSGKEVQIISEDELEAMLTEAYSSV